MTKQNKYDAGEFRVTLVGTKGHASTKKFTSHRKARRHFDEASKTPDFQYGIMLNIGDEDPNYWSIVEERTRGRVRTIEEP